MRSFSNVPLTTLLLLMPLLIIPLLAVFGIPEFAPVSASPSADFEVLPSLASSVDAGVGLSSRYTPEDLFASFASGGTLQSNQSATDMQDEWTDPFQMTEADSDSPGNSNWDRLDILGVTDSDADRIRFLADENGGEAISRERNPRDVFGVDSQSGADGGSRFAPASARNAGRSNRTDADRAANGFLSLVDFERARRRAVSGKSSVPVGRIDSPANASVRSPSAETDQPIPPAAVQPQSGESIRPFERASSQRVPGRNAPASAPSGEPLTWGVAVKRLNGLGIRHFQLEPGERAAEFHFSCFFTPPDNPKITHRFEAEAADPLIAVGKVLAQVERWSSQRR